MIFSRFPYISLCKTIDPQGGGGTFWPQQGYNSNKHGGGPLGDFWPHGYNLYILGKGSLGDASYQISIGFIYNFSI